MKPLTLLRKSVPSQHRGGKGAILGPHEASYLEGTSGGNRFTKGAQAPLGPMIIRSLLRRSIQRKELNAEPR